MTEFGKASFFEPIIVLDNSPNVQIGTSAAATCGDVVQRNAVLAPLPCDRTGGNDDATFFLFLKRKISKAAVVIQFQADAPRNIAGRQTASILDANVAKNAVTITEKMNAEGLNGEVSTFQSTALSRLENAQNHQPNCCGKQKSGSISKAFGESSEFARIFRNQTFVLGTLWFCGLITAAVGWQEVIKGSAYYGTIFLFGSVLLMSFFGLAAFNSH
jgi:hypothetical protein